jgi:hypothetical protein
MPPDIQLSKREKEVTKLVFQGMSNKQISLALDIMMGQIPIIVFFSSKWVPRTPKQALLVLALQGSAIMMVLAPVYLLKF